MQNSDKDNCSSVNKNHLACRNRKESQLAVDSDKMRGCAKKYPSANKPSHCSPYGQCYATPCCRPSFLRVPRMIHSYWLRCAAAAMSNRFRSTVSLRSNRLRRHYPAVSIMRIVRFATPVHMPPCHLIQANRPSRSSGLREAFPGFLPQRISNSAAQASRSRADRRLSHNILSQI